MNQETIAASTSNEQLKFPIGPFVKKEKYSNEELGQFIDVIEAAPISFRTLTETLSDIELAKTYREGSWNVRQLVHHVADIQMLHFLRMKKALTETGKSETTIILMDEWAKSPDSTSAPVKDSLQMLDGITKRYVYLLRSLTPAQLEISYYHPVRKYDITQAQAIAMSAWHLRHHHAHIQIAIDGSFKS